MRRGTSLQCSRKPRTKPYYPGKLWYGIKVKGTRVWCPGKDRAIWWGTPTWAWERERERDKRQRGMRVLITVGVSGVMAASDKLSTASAILCARFFMREKKERQKSIVVLTRCRKLWSSSVMREVWSVYRLRNVACCKAVASLRCSWDTFHHIIRTFR